MSTPGGVRARGRRGWADKREAITRGARAVFGREGYTRASIDAIATEAGVSTRTIYNHFRDKEDLFLTVIQDSATRVADAQIGLIDRYLDTVTDLEADLIAFGRVWATSTTAFAEHFALVRQIHAEVGHIPHTALEGWQETGPRRVHRALARRMRRFAEQGLLCIDDPDRAANHFTLLAATEVTNRTYYGAIPLDDDEVTQIATAGVRTFLHGHLPRDQDHTPSPGT